MTRTRRLGIGLAAVLLILGVNSPARSVEIRPLRWTTDNGMTVLLLERHSLPIVSLQLLVRAGSARDPEERAGVANMVAQLLDEGTATRSSKQIAEEADFIGAHLTTSASDDYSTAALDVLKKDLETGVELVTDVLRHPSFPDEEIERKRSQIIGQILSEKDNPGNVAEKAFNEMIFGQHPYHSPTEGTEATVPRITRADLVTFYEEYYRPNNAILAIVGDITPGEARTLLARRFRDWEPRAVPPLVAPPPPRAETRRSRVIDRNLTQANIILGQTGIERGNPDYYAVTVMNYILGGGGFSSRLLKQVRERQGLAYSIYSHFDAGVYPGSFSIVLQTRNSAAAQAIDQIMAEIQRIRREPVAEQELREAKAYLVGSFPLRIDTNSKAAALLTQIEFHALGLEYLQDYPAKIRAVSLDDVARVAKKYLDPEHMTLVMVAHEKEAQVRF